MFGISTGCGLDSVPAVLFRKKMLFIDISPIGFIRSYSSRHTITLKNYYNLTDKRKLTLNEIFDRCIGYITSTNEFSKNNVFLKESSPTELAMAAREMLTKINGKIVVTEEDKLNQILFWKKFKDTKNNEFKSFMHEKILCQISSSYLRNNLDILK
jgi:putative glycosyltransferase (TIGR04372 family)